MSRWKEHGLPICVGLGETYDYLHDQLFNCNQPIVTMGQSTMDVYAYFWTNDTLVLIGDDVSPGSYGVARSHEDGKLYYVSSSSTILYPPFVELQGWGIRDRGPQFQRRFEQGGLQ